jgi:DNA-binding NtrC family response regulator
MERTITMNSEQPAVFLNKPPPPLTPVPSKRILLLDCGTTSRDTRTTALRALGATVDCVGNGADARSLWKPGSHQIVLIDFRSAGADVHDFYRHVQETCSDQKFGFYTANPPYLTKSPMPCEPAGDQENSSPASQQLQGLVREAVATARVHVGVTEAARRIALIRTAARSGTVNGQERPHHVSFSDAVKMAERVVAAREAGHAPTGTARHPAAALPAAPEDAA